MSDHIRKQIRDAAVAALTGLATTGANVFSGRISPLRESERPALIVFLTGDDADFDAQVAGLTEARTGQLRIEGVAQANDTILDVLDQIALEAEAAICGNAALLALLMLPPAPPSSQIVLEDASGAGAVRLGSIVLSFPIQYRTRYGDASTKV